jgi:uncharacterized DUF497 family protein
VIELEYDSRKDAINRDKHGIGLAAAALILRGPHIRERSNRPNEQNEDRRVAVGRIEGRVMTCVYTLRSGVYRVISLRAARTSEKKAYDQIFPQK